MTNDQLYDIIAKHIFIAVYGTEIIILADDINHAKEKAKKFFGFDVAVGKISKTKSEGIFRI